MGAPIWSHGLNLPIYQLTQSALFLCVERCFVYAMRVSPNWLREFVDLRVDDRQLAEDLTLAGVAVESVRQQEGETIFEMEITTNRPDAMNHYGVARECSAIYDIALKPIKPKLPKVQTHPLAISADSITSTFADIVE